MPKAKAKSKAAKPKAKSAAPVGARSSAPSSAKPSNDFGARLVAIESKLEKILEALSRGAAPSARNSMSPQGAGPSLSSAASAGDADIAQFLSRTPLFAKLSPQECGILAGHCEVKIVGSGAPVFNEGDFGDAMYIVKSGTLEIFKKDLLGDVRIAEIRPGGLVGEMALVDGKPRSANVKAADEARLLSLSRSSYNELKKLHPQVATKFQDELLLLISSRLRQTTEKLVGK